MSDQNFYCTWPVDQEFADFMQVTNTIGVSHLEQNKKTKKLSVYDLTTCWCCFENEEQRQQHQIYEHETYVQNLRKTKYRQYLKSLIKDPLEQDPF